MDRAPQQQIEHYIKAYNTFDVGGMLRDLHPDVAFENIAVGFIPNKKQKTFHRFGPVEIQEANCSRLLNWTAL